MMIERKENKYFEHCELNAGSREKVSYFEVIIKYISNHAQEAIYSSREISETLRTLANIITDSLMLNTQVSDATGKATRHRENKDFELDHKVKYSYY